MRFQLLHINDTHSHFEPTPVSFQLDIEGTHVQVQTQSGGYARLKSAITKCQQQSKLTSLFLHAGDSFQGTTYFSKFKGLANAHLLNQLMPDAMTLGNHEFDLGNGPVRTFLDEVKFPTLSGNMDLSQEDPNKLTALSGHDLLYDYDPKAKIAKVLKKEIDGQTLAIFGITIDRIKDISFPDEDTLFHNAIETTQRTIDALYAQGIRRILVLSHLGYAGDLELADKVKGISVIVGGHSHTLQGEFADFGLDARPYGEMVHNTAVLQAGKFAETLGIGEVEIDEKGHCIRCEGSSYFLLSNTETLSVDAKHDAILPEVKKAVFQHSGVMEIEPDKSIEAYIEQKLKPAIDEMDNNVITTVADRLEVQRIPDEQRPEGCQVSPLVAQAMYMFASQQVSPLHFGLYNAGGSRVPLPAGDLTEAEIMGRLIPFACSVVYFKVAGKHLRHALECAIDNATDNGIQGSGTGSFPYGFNLRYEYQGDQPQEQRLTRLEVKDDQGQWVPVKDDAYYGGVSSSYTAAGKEGYDGLNHAVAREDLGTECAVAFIEFARALDTLSPNEERAVFYHPPRRHQSE